MASDSRNGVSKSTRGIPEDAVYPLPGSRQGQGTITRLRRRRLTPRIALAYAAALLILLFAQPIAITFAFGTVMVIAGVLLRIWSFGHLRKNQSLITTGPYAHTRNPAYLASFLIMTGLFVAAGNPFTPVGVALWIAGIIGIGVFLGAYMPRKYKREYGQLKRLFPEQIERHAANVPNFLPRLTPWRSGDTTRFSWACVSANHEWIWPLACALALIVMWI